jgi:hypothetical protein
LTVSIAPVTIIPEKGLAIDIGPYRREIAYGKEPIVPRLKPEQAEWATALLKPYHRRA